MSLYAQYIKEREQREILEDEQGFATYVIEGNECYIQDIFTVQEARKKGHAAKLADQISEIAKKRGAKYLTGSVDPSLDNATDSMKVLLAYGMRVHSMQPPLVFFIKEL